MDDLRALHFYLVETTSIPAWLLQIAVVLVIRSRVYPSLPSIGELWETAREAAGMKRSRYRAGHYLGPPREWPPEGRRHAIEFAQLESLGIETECARLEFKHLEPQITEGS